MSTTTRGNPADILDLAFERASTSILQPIVNNPGIVSKIEYVCRNRSNRACSRFLLACTLAKSHNPTIDIRKPYTEIGGSDTYSGRYYDEHFIGAFVMLHDLPCNTTTAFLTPGFRTKNITLTPDIDLAGGPAQLYQTTLSLLTDIYEDQAPAEDVLAETIRWLLIVKDERLQQLQT